MEVKTLQNDLETIRTKLSKSESTNNKQKTEIEQIKSYAD